MLFILNCGHCYQIDDMRNVYLNSSSILFEEKVKNVIYENWRMFKFGVFGSQRYIARAKK